MFANYYQYFAYILGKKMSITDLIFDGCLQIIVHV